MWCVSGSSLTPHFCRNNPFNPGSTKLPKLNTNHLSHFANMGDDFCVFILTSGIMCRWLPVPCWNEDQPGGFMECLSAREADRQGAFRPRFGMSVSTVKRRMFKPRGNLPFDYTMIRLFPDASKLLWINMHGN